MMVKVFTVGKNDKIEFTKDELEKLLNEVWEDGRKDGLNSNRNYLWSSPKDFDYYGTPSKDYWWISPTITCDTITQGSISCPNPNVATNTTTDNVKLEF